MSNPTEIRFLEYEGTRNLRDIGGYTTRSGQKTRYKRLLRSAGLDTVPVPSQQMLFEYGLRHIIDLRDEWEQASYRNVFTEHPTIRYANIPFMGIPLQDEVSKRTMNEVKTQTAFYEFLLERCQPQVARIVQSLTALPENECALVHCYAGKDRTGLIVALVLGAVDVPTETISQDYALSGLLSAWFLSQWVTENDDEIKLEQLKRQASATEETMNETFAWLEKKYGGAADYLSAAGVADKTLEQLQRRLVE